MEGYRVLFKSIDTMSRKTFAAIKWLLTAISGALTTGLIVILES